MSQNDGYESIRQMARRVTEDKEQWKRFRREMQMEYFFRWLASEGAEQREEIFKEYQGFDVFCAKLEVLAAQQRKKDERSR